MFQLPYFIYLRPNFNNLESWIKNEKLKLTPRVHQIYSYARGRFYAEGILF